MQRSMICLLAGILCAHGALAQQTASPQPATPQTARQALMEMFGKTPGTLVKHLPAATRAALEKSGVLAQLQQYSTMMGETQTQGQNLQTFETGPVMLATVDPKTGQKVEVTVENDVMHGDRDDIEVSFRVYKDGKAQRTPFMPQITFVMKQEAKVWTLNEISVTLHLPLADPDLLQALNEKIKPRTANVALTAQDHGADHSADHSADHGATQPSGPHVTFTAQNESVMPPAGSDSAVIAAMHTILAAEITYAKTYPNVGYTCTLSSLDGFGGGEPNERQAMLINSGLASGKRYGFVFILSGCAGGAAKAFQLTAAPNGNYLGRKAFCADQSGVIRSSDDGNPATCMDSGTAVQ